MRKLSTILIVVLGVGFVAAVVLLGAWKLGGGLIVRARPASITEIAGTVLYSPAGDSQWSTAVVGMAIERGDQLLTQFPDGEVTVQFDDGNIAFMLKPDSLATITAGWNVILETGTAGVDLQHGRLVAGTLQDAPVAETSFHIATQTAEVSIEGTWLVVQALRNEPTTLVTSLEGDVYVRAKAADAALYRPDAQRLPEREMLVTDRETLIVYTESPDAQQPALGSNIGRVVDPQSGDGYQGAVVQVVGSPELYAISAEDGYFDIQGTAPHSELALIGAAEGGTGESDELELRPDVGRVTGRVVDAVSGEGIAQAKIRLVGQPEITTETDADGNFTLEEIPLGTHTLAISAGGHIDMLAEASVGAEVLVVIADIPMAPQTLIPWAYLPLILEDWVQYGQYP